MRTDFIEWLIKQEAKVSISYKEDPDMFSLALPLTEDLADQLYDPLISEINIYLL